MTYGFIGTGNMGGALARALTKSVEAQSVQLCNRSPEKAKRLAEELGAHLTLLPGDVAADCDVVFLGVKPHLLLELLAELRPVLDGRREKPLLVSMAAGVTIAAIEQAVPGCPVLRIMPNTACAVGAGLTLYARNDLVTEESMADFLAAMSASGRMEQLPESLIDAASAGAFACLFMEALADGAVACGLPRDKSNTFAAQMLLGAAQLSLESGKPFGKMKDEICSPGGTTIAGVRALEEGGFRAAAMNAVIAAYEKTLELKK